jgi:hypothetical protein
MATLTIFYEPVAIALTRTAFIIGSCKTACFYKNDTLHFHISLN